jgi:hypothetical protein
VGDGSRSLVSLTLTPSQQATPDQPLTPALQLQPTSYSCGPWNDTSVAKANHAFLKNLFTHDFPEYAQNDLFITGESYAGIYVPTIVREILIDPGPLNLKGFAVGDGCMGTEVLCGAGNPDKGPWYRVEFMHGHGQVSERASE